MKTTSDKVAESVLLTLFCLPVFGLVVASTVAREAGHFHRGSDNTAWLFASLFGLIFLATLGSALRQIWSKPKKQTPLPENKGV